MQEQQPLYILPQKKSRAIVPKILTLVLLGAIFYIGILLNIALLELKGNSQTIVEISSLIIVLSLIMLGSYLAWHRSTFRYLFFPTFLKWSNKTLSYVQIVNTSPSRDVLDKMFSTYSINIGNGMIIRNIPKEVDLPTYLQKLVQYTRQRQTS